MVIWPKPTHEAQTDSGSWAVNPIRLARVGVSECLHSPSRPQLPASGASRWRLERLLELLSRCVAASSFCAHPIRALTSTDAIRSDRPTNRRNHHS